MTDTMRSKTQGIDEFHTAYRLLSAGIPLTLLLDLASPVHSKELFEVEGGRADWLSAGVA